MQISHITYNNKNLFSAVIPDYILAEANTSTFRGLGIIDSKDSKDYAAGAICYFISNKTCQLEWLYIHEDFRGKNLSMELLRALFLDLQSTSVENIICYLPYSEEYDDIVSLLVDYDFVLEETKYYHTYLDSEYMRSSFNLADMPVSNNVIPLSKESPIDVKKYLKSAFEPSPLLHHLFTEPTDITYLLDDKLSCVLLDTNREIQGCLLIRKLTDTFFEIVKFSTSASAKHAENLSLVAYAVNKMISEYSDASVHILLPDEKSSSILSKLFTDVITEPLVKLSYDISSYSPEEE